MSSFLRYVLWEFKNSLVIVAIAAIAALLVLFTVYWLCKKKYRGEQKFPWARVMLTFVMAGFLLIVLYATIFRHAGGYREWNLHIFRAWLEAWNDFSVKSWANVLLNVAMFVPLGFLLPLYGRKMRKWYLSVGIGFFLSLLIELLQLVSRRGICDIDDLFANTLGAAFGYFLVMLLLGIFSPKGERLKPVLINGSFAILPVVFISSIFLAYEMKEFGNFPNAATYQNNTAGVTWSLECDLPKADGYLSLYQTTPLNKNACDELADILAYCACNEVLLSSYYQEMAYYNLSGGVLTIYYFDGSYSLSVQNTQNSTSLIKNRSDVERELAQFHISVPETANFSLDKDGWYIFSCNRHMSGDNMFDGTLRCQFSSDGAIRRIDNHLNRYTYYRKTQILSAQDAYELLCAGKFNDGGFFEQVKPTELSVTDCILDYQTDTKGFYRPVYRFSVVSHDNAYQYQIMIPAM